MIGKVASIVCFSVASFCYIGFSYWKGKKWSALFFKLPNDRTKRREESAEKDTIKRLNSIAIPVIPAGNQGWKELNTAGSLQNCSSEWQFSNLDIVKQPEKFTNAFYAKSSQSNAYSSEGIVVAIHKLFKECEQLAEESNARIIRITNVVAQIEKDHAEIRNQNAEIRNQHAKIKNKQSENKRRIEKLDKDFLNLNTRINLYKTKKILKADD